MTHPLAPEIEKVEEEIAALERQLPALEREYRKLSDKAHKTGLRLLAASDSGNIPAKLALQSEEEDRQAHTARSRYESTLDRIRIKRDQLKRLHDPREIERRTEQRLRLNNLKESKMAKKETAKDQGFPAEYLGENGNFKPGLDARAKSDLVNAFLGLESKGALATFTKDEAQKLLKKRGWMSFVEKKQASIAAAQAKKEAAAAKRAEEKAATAGNKPSGGDDDVTPDPKPAPKAKKGGRKVAA